MSEDTFGTALIQDKLTTIEKVVLLQNVDIFAEVPTEQLAYVASIAEELSFAPDEIIYKELDVADALYVVISGKVEMRRDQRDISQAGPSGAFGTWSLFDTEPRVVTAVAREATKLLRVDREDFLELLSDHVQITQGILKTFAGRLRHLVDKFSGDKIRGTENK